MKSKLPEAIGDCFKANYNAMLTKSSKDGWRLCHGIVVGRGSINGVEHVHAWLEQGDKVHDYSMGSVKVVDKLAYYAVGQIESSRVVQYSMMEALTLALKSGNYGCWDKMFVGYP